MDGTEERELRKGRGAVTNRPGRFEAHGREAFDDGWQTIDEALPRLHTTFRADSSRTIIAHNTSPDLGFDRSINPYRGCEHGCVYCFARPTHAFLGLSPGQDFESRIFTKPEAPKLLREVLGKKSYQPRLIAMGTNTDPYQPVERRLEITRSVLEVLWEHRHPVGIVTKSDLVTRDLDVLGAMAAEGLAFVALSVTTLDRGLAQKLEPRAATPAKRLAAIEALAQAGVPAGVMVAPVIPALTDPEMEAILEAASTAGASEAGYILLRMPLEIKELFEEWLRAHAPNKAERVLALMRETRDGALYRSGFHTRMVGTGTYAELLSKRFALATKRLGLARRGRRLDVSQFRVPPRAGDQLDLF